MNSHKEGRPTVVAEARNNASELPLIRGGGGQRDMRKLSRVQRSGGGIPPPRRYLDVIQITPLDPRQRVNDVKVNDDKRPRAEQQLEIVAREDLVDLRRRRTQGRLRGARGRVFLAVSPLMWRPPALRIALQS